MHKPTNIVTGNVKNSQTKENLSAISMLDDQRWYIRTFTDEKGNFRLATTQKPPFVVVVSLYWLFA